MNDKVAGTTPTPRATHKCVDIKQTVEARDETLQETQSTTRGQFKLKLIYVKQILKKKSIQTKTESIFKEVDCGLIVKT